jgi:acetolactate synthase-1/3 small subunit
MRLVDVFRARVVDVGPESLMIETTGTEDKNDKLVEVLRPYGVLELVRTGRVAMGRGSARHSASEALQAEDDDELEADGVGLLDVSV